MNLLRAASHKTFRRMLGNAMSSNVNIMIRGFATTAENLESEQVAEKMNQSGDCVSYNTLISDMSKAEELSCTDRTRQMKRLSPNKTIYTSLIDSFCKQDRFDVAHRVLNEMIVSGFPPSFVTLNDVLRGLLRFGDMRNAYEMRNKMNQHSVICWKKNKNGWMDDDCWMDVDTKFSLYQGLSDEVTYTSLMNAYLDEGKLDDAEELYDEMRYLDKLFNNMPPVHQLPRSVIKRVYINGLKNLLRFNYKKSLCRPILEYHQTLAENYGDDKSLVELVNIFYKRGLENAYDPDEIEDDGLVYNLYVIAHCKRHNIVEAYNMYQDMVHYGFACHMFTMFALIKTLKREDMVNELLWVIQNVLRSCYFQDSRIVNFLIDFNPKEPDSEALFDALAAKAAKKTTDSMFL